MSQLCPSHVMMSHISPLYMGRTNQTLDAHIWRSLMSSILSSNQGMAIFGHIVVINPYNRPSLTRTIDSSINGARAFNRCTPLYAIWKSLMSSILSTYQGFMPIYGDPSCHHYFNPISIWPTQTMIQRPLGWGRLSPLGCFTSILYTPVLYCGMKCQIL